MSGEILLAREGDIATVTLSNPGKLNALGLGSWKRLGEAMRALDADKALRCIVGRGAAGERLVARAPHHDAAQDLVGVELAHRLSQPLPRAEPERVELARVAQRDGGDVAIALEKDFPGHELFPMLSS